MNREPVSGCVRWKLAADDGVCDAGHCSLREAVNAANSVAGDDTIVFLPTLTGTILLQAALPNLATNITIDGLGVNVLTVQRNAAAGNFRIFTEIGIIINFGT